MNRFACFAIAALIAHRLGETGGRTRRVERLRPGGIRGTCGNGRTGRASRGILIGAYGELNRKSRDG